MTVLIFFVILIINYTFLLCFALRYVAKRKNGLCLDPSAADLIALFLYQADVASSITREIVGKENVSVNGTQAPTDAFAQCDGSSLFIL